MLAPKRNEIWLADLPDTDEHGVICGRRPVMIISNDKGNLYSNTVLVAPITKNIKKMPTHVLLEQKNYETLLEYDSVVQAESIRMISKENLLNRKGVVRNVDSKKMKKALELAMTEDKQLRVYDYITADKRFTQMTIHINYAGKDKSGNTIEDRTLYLENREAMQTVSEYINNLLVDHEFIRKDAPANARDKNAVPDLNLKTPHIDLYIYSEEYREKLIDKRDHQAEIIKFSNDELLNELKRRVENG